MTSDATFLLKYIDRKSFLPSTNGTVRLDQDSFFQVFLHFARLKLSELHLHASYFVHFSHPRVSWEIRLDNSDESFRLASHKANNNDNDDAT